LSPDVLDFYAAADVVSPSRVSDRIHDALDGLVLREAREAQTLSQWIERLQAEPDLRRKGGEAASKRSSSGTGIGMRLRYGNFLKNEGKAHARLESYPVAALVPQRIMLPPPKHKLAGSPGGNPSGARAGSCLALPPKSITLPEVQF
jgi:hypothetical protein